MNPLTSVNQPWIPIILSQIATSGIEELVLCVFVGRGGLEAFNWDAIADIPAETSFLHLRTLRISAKFDSLYSGFDVSCDQSEVMDLIKRKLPTWAARGVLLCDVQYWQESI